MTGSFIESICALAKSPRSLTEDEKCDAALAFEDTLASMLAGWFESASTRCRAAFAGNIAPLFDGSFAASIEHVAFIQGVAAHALDYDDVNLVGVTHPSAVLVPALLALADSRPETVPRLLAAYAVGLGVNTALGRALGFGHYEKGWHATSTIGPVAGAAALAHLLSLDDAQTRSAVALAAAQSGGLQRNFGSMAKPVQAGNAAAAAVRSTLLARAGVSGDADIFGPKGYFDLFGNGANGGSVDVQMGTLSRKLYPCCYATHRLIAASFALRAQLPVAQPLTGFRFSLDVPFGTMQPLQITDPKSGSEAKFCAAYVVAVALARGAVTLEDFDDETISLPDLREIMDVISISEEPQEGDMPEGLDHGTMRMQASRDGHMIANAQVVAYPGSPASPPTRAQMDAKVSDCLARFNREAQKPIDPEKFKHDLYDRLGVA